ncbi:hypothetical protein D9619_001571 [Psilocybe cf. subviscida]|uniref:Uncharacterized protein n=1 Tax=Psilocybe cf. subviscida TaxID=2480587 RepID=A0A8H5F2A4_9AGAR|nr:hypothetical protein D9619_001571 [Psilocybe cf. subviscida]
MNILRSALFQQSLRVSSSRGYAAARAFSASSCRREETATRESTERPKPIPESPAFYTTRAVFYEQLMHLEKAIGRSESFLRQNHLLPLPEFAKASLPALQPVWKNQYEMSVEFQTQMTTTRYRKITKLLNTLNDFLRIARTGGCPELAARLEDILSIYESAKKEAFLKRGKKKTVVLDEFGRSYTVGKRKTSSARVWMIPVQHPEVDAPKGEPTPESLLGLELAAPKPKLPVTTTTILVNNIPLNQFFTLPEDRERITRPLKVAGALGKYNVFAIVRGGGTTGQSGALAHGIAQGVVAHDPALEVMFRRSKLSRRDPRMVERKKTGLAKARKRYAWVKR